MGATVLLMWICVGAAAPTQTIQNQGPVVTYRGGLLTIVPHSSPLREVLNAIRDRVGFSLDVPSSGMDARVLDQQIGPAPVKEAMIQLLYGCGVDYLIQTPSRDPQNVNLIIVTKRPQVAEHQGVVASAEKQPDGAALEPQLYGATIPPDTSFEQAIPIHPTPGQTSSSSTVNVPGVPPNFNLQDAAAAAHKTPGEILEELQRRQNEILDSMASPE